MNKLLSKLPEEDIEIYQNVLHNASDAKAKSTYTGSTEIVKCVHS
jgi:hypothetical protein